MVGLGWLDHSGMAGGNFFQVGTCAKCTARLKLPKTASNLWICHRISSMKARENVVFNDFGRSSDSTLKKKKIAAPFVSGEAAGT